MLDICHYIDVYLLPAKSIVNHIIQCISILTLPSQCMYIFSDFIWPFFLPYMGVIPNQKMAFIFPNSCIFALIFPLFMEYFPKCEGRGSFPKSQIKSLILLFVSSWASKPFGFVNKHLLLLCVSYTSLLYRTYLFESHSAGRSV